MSPAATVSRGRPLVTAVIVAHDGVRWLPRLLATLENQTRLPDRLVAVNTGSRDGTRQMLEQALGADAVVTTERDLGFGAAVAAGLAALDSDHSSGPDAEHWVWLLHDDMALDPHALANLLDAVRADLAVVGPKVREWPHRKRLLEMGLTVTGTARRVTGVDPGEYDQGQHDRVTDTLAVGSAGMLVRRTAWDRLGGFDPALPLFGDDLDLGWRAARDGLRVAVAPEAVVFHAEASARGQRSIDAAAGRPRRLSREHALYAVLANCRGAVLPLVAVRLLLGSVLRALGLLVLKAPRESWDEMTAAAAVLGRPGRVWAGRRRRRGQSRRHRRRVRRLLAPWWAPYGQGLEVVGQVAAEALEAVAERTRAEPDAAADAGTRAETGPVAEEAQNLAVGPGPVARLLRRPMGLALTLLVLLSLFAGPPLVGAGLLQGGALLPAPPGAADWWRTYAESWHPVAQGGDAAAPPYVAVLGVLATVLLGKAWLVVHVLFGLAVPLTAAAGYLLARRLVASRPVAVWAAVTYGLLPVLTGAVAQGRLGTVVAAVVTPLVARCALGAATATTPQRRWRAAIGAGLLLAVLAAFVPMALLVALVLAAASWPFRGRDPALPARLAAMLATATVLLLPWLGQFGVDLAAWSAAEAGWEGGLATASPASRWDLLLGRPGGPGQAPGWLTAGLVLAAVAALLRADRRGVVLRAWGVGLTALAVVALQQRLGAWPGFSVLLAQGAAVLAAAAAADGGLTRLGGASFGWRQPLVAAVALATAVVPVLGAGWLLFADHPEILHRAPRVPVPAFMADAQRGPHTPRTLLISAAGSGMSVHLSRGPGLYLGQDAVAPPAPAGLTDIAAALVSEPTQQDVAALATYGVEFVLLTGADRDAVTAVDGAPGLVRSSAGERPGTAWRLDASAGPVRLGDRVLPSEAGTVRTRVAAAAKPRTLTLGEQADAGWTASLDGRELPPRTVDGWAQGFVLPPAGGALEVQHDNGRDWWLAGQLLVLLVALVLAAPGRERRDATL
jgi:GT2 family glycosyltransferase